MGRRWCSCLVVLLVVMLALTAVVAAEAAPKIVVSPLAVVCVGPDASGGLGLSLRTVPLYTQDEKQAYLWLDGAFLTSDWTAWRGYAGLSTEARLIKELTFGLADAGGLGYDFGTNTLQFVGIRRW